METNDAQERMTEVLEKYKELKKRSHGTASRSVENGEEAIRLLKEKNKISKEISNSEEPFIVEEQAYKDAEEKLKEKTDE